MIEALPEQGRAQRSRLRVLEAAVELFGDRGFEGAKFKDIAERAGVSVGLACRYFPTKEHLALALYARLADELEAWAATEMPNGTVAARFAAAARQKLAILGPHRRALTALAARAIDPTARAAVVGPGAEVVRATVSGVFSLVVRGATDAPAGDQAAEALARTLYALHLLVVLVFLEDLSDGAAVALESIDLARAGLEAFGPMLAPALGSAMGARVDALFGSLLGTGKAIATGKRDRARLILGRIFRRRRMPGADAGAKPGEPSEAALALHLPRVRAFVDAGAPIELVLPAFPAKAPNPRKVLGALPDAAERLALESLADLCGRARARSSPGRSLRHRVRTAPSSRTLVGVRDADVLAYRQTLEAMISDLGERGAFFRVFALDDAFGSIGAGAARKLLLERWGEDLDVIHERAHRSPRVAAHVDGIHRFLAEDEIARRPELTRSQAKKATRERAYEVAPPQRSVGPPRRRGLPGRYPPLDSPAARRLRQDRRPPRRDRRRVAHAVARHRAARPRRLSPRPPRRRRGDRRARRRGGRSAELFRGGRIMSTPFVTEPIEPFGLVVHVPGRDTRGRPSPRSASTRWVAAKRVVVFRGLAPIDKRDLPAAARRLGPLQIWPFGAVNELKVDAEKKNYLFSNGPVPLHYDGAFAGKVPRYLFFQCVAAPGEGAGGETTFVDTTRVWAAADDATKDRLRALTFTYETERVVHYGGRFPPQPVVPRAIPHTGETVLRFAELRCR